MTVRLSTHSDLDAVDVDLAAFPFYDVPRRPFLPFTMID
jgi:hypothetical protein